jgi:ComF family protein
MISLVIHATKIENPKKLNSENQKNIRLFLNLLNLNAMSLMNYLIDLFFPPQCQACASILKDNEFQICVACRHQLPVTNYHFQEDHPLQHLFFGRIYFVSSISLFYFQKHSRVQKLLHNLKYKQQKSVGTTLGLWLGREMKASKRFDKIDLVVPVPTHKKRLKKRGYNQVLPFASAIAKVFGVLCDDTILVKIKHTKTQVFQTKEERWKSVVNSFQLVKKDKIIGKHILLVDDLITTGATIEACSKVLLDAGSKHLSLATIAIASSVFR